MGFSTVCSTCFNLRGGEDGLSVDLEHLTTLEQAIKDRTKYRLLRLIVGKVQELNLKVEHDPYPTADPENFAHTLIKGSIDKKISRKLASISIVI